MSVFCTTVLHGEMSTDCDVDVWYTATSVYSVKHSECVKVAPNIPFRNSDLVTDNERWIHFTSDFTSTDIRYILLKVSSDYPETAPKRSNILQNIFERRDLVSIFALRSLDAKTNRVTILLLWFGKSDSVSKTGYFIHKEIRLIVEL